MLIIEGIMNMGLQGRIIFTGKNIENAGEGS